MFNKISISACVLISAMVCVASAPSITLAQSIFQGISAEDQLPFRLAGGGVPKEKDSYTLKIPGIKIKAAVSEFSINYPETFDGQFDINKVTVKVGSKAVPAKVAWDKDSRTLLITPENPIESRRTVDIVLANVQNPSRLGKYNFNCQSSYENGAPSTYLGTWILNIGL